MRVALVHDWLTAMRGGEWVLAEIAAMFPRAPIYTLIHRRGVLDPSLEQHPITTSWLQKVSFGGRAWRPFLSLMPAAIEGMALEDADLVISSSHCVAKGVIPPPRALHVSYVHTPMRYAWDQRESYLKVVPRGLRWIVNQQLKTLRQWDMVSATRADRLVANSRLVAWRIRRYWNREAEVMSPPVDTEFFTPGGPRGDALLTVAALVPYKRVEVAMEVARRLGRPLEVVGTGHLRRRLERIADSNVRFLGWLDRSQLRDAYRRAQALLVPNIEDFGMATVEALACGTPVVGVDGSGTADTVRPGVDGELAPEPTADALCEAAARVLTADHDPGALRRRAEMFSREQFRTRFRFLLGRLNLPTEAQ